jgi:hypothetical protein
VHDAIAYGLPLVVVGAGWLVRTELAKRAAVAAQPVPARPVVTEPAATEPVPAEEVPV